MRFNQAELETLVINPTTKFDKQGILIITEPAGIFRNASCPRWCKLRGNLLFYLKDHDPRSSPAGLLVLENCRPLIRNKDCEVDGYAFVLEFGGGVPQRIAAQSDSERLDWVRHIQLASSLFLNHHILTLQKEIARKRMGNRIEHGTLPCAKGSDVMLMNAASAVAAAATASSSSKATANKVEEDLAEIPICESALSCDSLPLRDNGRAPTTRVICEFLTVTSDFCDWQEFARTEVFENSSCPQFLRTICFRVSDGFTAETLLRFTLYDVREKMSVVSIPMGYAEVRLGVIQDATRFRIPLRSLKSECGFITIASWAADTDKQTPPRSTTQVFEQQPKAHRRTQSLPCKLGVKLFVPFHGNLQCIFANPMLQTYRIQTGICGDISVQEALLESKLCFAIPQQLLSIWILREKELLQEISGMGELGGEWRRRQMDLLDKHLKLLKDYSQAKQNLRQLCNETDTFFKRSSNKTDESLEFLPVNLHLSRMSAQNDSIGRTGLLDIITVGAFTRHAVKARTGGLIKLLQEAKESPSKFETGNQLKVQLANDAVQAIKQLRKEIVQIMSQLLLLAKHKNPKGMMSLCNEMIGKTKSLLHIWEPSLVEEAFSFIEQHRIIEEPDNVLMPASPFRQIRQQLSALNLKSPDLEDFATPVVAPPDLWPRAKTPRSLERTSSLNMLRPSPSTADIGAISNLHNAVKRYNEQLQHKNDELADAELNFMSLPVNLEDVSTTHANAEQQQVPLPLPQENVFNDDDLLLMEHDYDDVMCMTEQRRAMHNTGFLDTKMMSCSASANFYRPTEEPEPLDLTQLNIEASMMCLVSKIKFLCGRNGSPAIRLRHPKTAMKREGFSNSNIAVVAPPDVLSVPLKKQQKQQQQMLADEAVLSLNLSPEVNASSAGTDSNAVTSNGAFAKKGNKFTDGLDLSLTNDWTTELRPSMRKLRHAMDGLLKTARLMHSVQRLQQDMKRNSANLEIMYRRDVCFSQALTALISALLCKLWSTEITENFIKILCDLGPLAYFEGLLSLHGGEVDMWGDMCIAIEDLSAINFTLVRSQQLHNCNGNLTPLVRITGSRQSLNVLLPVPEQVHAIIPTQQLLSFKVTPVFFNIGINEKATIAETLGFTREQHRSNWDNFMRLRQYYSRYCKLKLIVPDSPSKHEPHMPAPQVLFNLLNLLEEQLRANVSKNVKILHLAEDACRFMYGLRFTSCKSAKDRTGMAVTLEQCRVLVQEFNLPAKSVPHVLNTMRSEGTRMNNVAKNINKRKYAFNLPQVLSLPAMYRPPAGCYGKAET